MKKLLPFLYVVCCKAVSNQLLTTEATTCSTRTAKQGVITLISLDFNQAFEKILLCYFPNKDYVDFITATLSTKQYKNIPKLFYARTELSFPVLLPILNKILQVPRKEQVVLIHSLLRSSDNPQNRNPQIQTHITCMKNKKEECNEAFIHWYADLDTPIDFGKTGIDRVFSLYLNSITKPSLLLALSVLKLPHTLIHDRELGDFIEKFIMKSTFEKNFKELIPLIVHYRLKLPVKTARMLLRKYLLWSDIISMYPIWTYGSFTKEDIAYGVECLKGLSLYNKVKVRDIKAKLAALDIYSRHDIYH